MATTTYKTLQPNQTGTLYSSNQMIVMVTAFVMIILAAWGAFDPTFVGLQLSLMHCFVLAGAGVLTVWAGLSADPEKMFKVSAALGVFFMVNAIAGFLLGEPGQTRMVNVSDELLLKVAPGFLELTTVDHTFHTVLAIVYFFDAYMNSKRIGKATVLNQTPFE